ncbi:SUKH superfamily protein [Planomicrobium soli]|uniref:SUKH superfamily protein n=1 Tax=Planomicrobium soli TaxID=1176648 RepID=A0A2P8H5Y1_9BACL|nr:SUKH superfamily protein [Planomicrobium soli]
MKDIWQEGSENGKLEPLSDEIVKEAEKLLKIKLPTSYISILKQQNGGYIKFNAHPSAAPTSWADDHVNVENIFGIGTGKEKGILESEYLIQEWGLPKNVVLISGDGHSWIALDYRNSKADPPVIYLDVEQNQEIRLAKNFEEFINGLVNYIEEEKIYISDTDLSEKEIKNYYAQIDEVIQGGTPKEIDRLFTRILSTNNELIRYMVEKMRHHEKPKVHFYLLLFLMSCAQGDNKGMIEDHYLLPVLHELSKSKNKDVEEFALYSLHQLQTRLNT